MTGLSRYFPVLAWGWTYDRDMLAGDLLAAVIVTIMLIPQSLAYAMLAGLPPEVGLYASILPLAAYALFGTSRTLAVGPVAVVSLMTASAIGQIAAQGGPADQLAAAGVLALLSGGMLTLMGVLRLGFLANFLSHPVISGFITAAGVFTAAGIALAALYLTPLLESLPQATLAATIIVAVLSLVDLGAIRRVHAYSRSDFAAMAATILVTLGWGVEPGIVAGMVLSLLLHLYRTSRPHMAVVGQVPGTEHYRNVERHAVLTRPDILSIRVDESLYFANARFLEDRIAALVAERPELKHVVLMCSAVNAIDASALESLEEINRRLADAGIGFHLSEVKGPVMDRLETTDFPRHLHGRIFLSQHEAIGALAGVGAR